MDEIAILEEKIEALIGYIKKITEEKNYLMEKIAQKDAEIENLKLELAQLQDEKSVVKSKIGEILQKIEQVGLGSPEPTTTQASSELPLKISKEETSTTGF
ncbi:hypothetical protein TH606_10300 [Thermodesulfatator autotrophicus]|uniref:Cell division protein ZapB n=2 Tax=Thermodesulfatator autotrophicus TaxID=1795632 RepID=A0A177E5Q6_9BACT|nr:hypothetical protein TH606_10300 [Thermodesulfatator autotrophicus]